MHAGGREDREKEMEREINKEVCSLIHPQRRVFSSVWRENVLKVALLCMVPGQIWHMVKTHVIDGRWQLRRFRFRSHPVSADMETVGCRIKPNTRGSYGYDNRHDGT